MLTPAIDDVNRKAELDRKSKDPRSFGTPRIDVREIAARNLTGHNLVTEKVAQTTQPTAQKK